MLDDLVKLKAEAETFRHQALRWVNFSPTSDATASYALSQSRFPVSPDFAASAALLAERAIKLCEGIACLKDFGG